MKKKMNEISDELKQKVLDKRKAQADKANAKLNRANKLVANSGSPALETVTVTFNSGECFTEEDVYEEGATGSSGTSWDNDRQVTFELNLTDPNFAKTLAEKAGEYLYCYWVGDDINNINVVKEGDNQYSLRFSVMGNVDNEEPSEREYEDWKKGETRLWIIDGFISLGINPNEAPYFMKALEKAGVYTEEWNESLKPSRKSSRKMNENNLDTIWTYLVDYGIATDEEISLVTTINGYTEEALNDIIYARTGMRDFEQLQGEEEYDESLKPSRRRKSVNENKNFMGLEGIETIWHGHWSDPEITYQGHTFNYWDFEEALYTMCKEDIEEGYFKGNADNDEDFARWVQENTSSVYGVLDDWIAFQVGESLKPSRRRKPVNEDFGVEYRNMHDGIHRLLITDTEEKAREVLDYLKQLENPNQEVIDQNEYDDFAFVTWDMINSLANDYIEINYRDVDDNGMYGDIQVINYDEPKPDIYESYKPSRRRKPVNEISDKTVAKTTNQRLANYTKASADYGKGMVKNYRAYHDKRIKNYPSNAEVSAMGAKANEEERKYNRNLELVGKRNARRTQQESLSSSLIKSAHSVLSMNEGAGDEMNTWSFKAKGFSKMLENKQPTFGTNELRCTISENLDGKLEGVVVTNYAMTKSQVEEALKEALRQNGFKSTSITELTVLY